MRFLPRLALIVLLITPLRALAQPFTLSITPKTQSYTGVAPVYTISGAPGSGFSASIYLSAHSDALPGTTFSLSSNKINPPYNSTVTLTVTLPTYYTNGTHAIIVEGSNGPALARDTCWLVIDVPPKTGWTVYNTYNSGVPSNEINDVSFEPGGAIWVSTHKGASVYDGNTWTLQHPVFFVSSYGPSVTLARADSSGNVWIAESGRVGERHDGKWRTYDDASNRTGMPLGVESITVDTAGNVWILFSPGELWRSNGNAWIKFTSTNSPLSVASGVGSRTVAAPDGNIWVAGNGIDRYDGTYWTNFSREQLGMPYGNIHSIAVEGNGNVWAVNAYGLVKISGQTVTKFPRTGDRAIFPGPAPARIGVAPDGSLWVSQESSSGGGIIRYRDGRSWNYNSGNSSLPDNEITALTVSPGNRIWVGTKSGGLAMFDGNAPVDTPSSVAGSAPVRFLPMGLY